MMAPSLVNWLYVRVVELSVEVGLGIIRGLGDGNCLYVVCKWGEGQFEVASCVAVVVGRKVRRWWPVVVGQKVHRWGKTPWGES